MTLRQARRAIGPRIVRKQQRHKKGASHPGRAAHRLFLKKRSG